MKRIVTILFALVLSISVFGMINSSGVSQAKVIVPVNIALGKDVKASAYAEEKYKPANVVDGKGSYGAKDDTRWVSPLSTDSTKEEWIYIDLNGLYAVSRVKLFWKWDHIWADDEYEIQYSQDATIWTTVSNRIDETFIDAGVSGVDGASISTFNYPERFEAKFVRFLSTMHSNQWGVSVVEFEVYGEKSLNEITDVSTPTGLAAVASTNSVCLNWTANPDTDGKVGYEIYRDGVPVGKTLKTTFTDDDIASDTEFIYKICAYKDSLKSNKSDRAVAKTLSNNVIKNISVKCSTTSSDNFDISNINDENLETRWESKVGITGIDEWIKFDLQEVHMLKYLRINWDQAYARTFNIYLSNNGSEWKLDTTNAYSGTSQMITFGEFTRARYIKISANNFFYAVWGLSIQEIYLDAEKTDIKIENIGAPEYLQADNITSNSVLLNWDLSKVVGDAQGYEIYRNGELIKNIDSSSVHSYTDTNLSANTVYNYQILSYAYFKQDVNIDDIFLPTKKITKSDFGDSVKVKTLTGELNDFVPSNDNILSRGLKFSAQNYSNIGDAQIINNKNGIITNLVDNDLQSFWRVANPNNEWVIFDLNEVKNVKSIHIYQSAKNYNNQFEFYSSTDKQEWSLVLSSSALLPSTENGFAKAEINNLSCNARYIKFETIGKQENSLDIAEIEIYGGRSASISPINIPFNVRIEDSSLSGATIAWDYGNVDIINEFIIYKNGVEVSRISKHLRSYFDSNMSPSTAYMYNIAATNHSGVTSFLSSAVIYNSPARISALGEIRIAESLPGELVVEWERLSDETFVAGYNVYCNKVLAGTTTNNRFTVSGLGYNAQYTFYVTVVDVSGLESSKSESKAGTTLPMLESPSELRTVNVLEKSITLKWNLPKYNINIVNYKLFRKEVDVKGDNKFRHVVTTKDCEFTDYSISGNTAYEYYVVSVDNINNYSAKSNILSVVSLNDGKNIKDNIAYGKKVYTNVPDMDGGRIVDGDISTDWRTPVCREIKHTENCQSLKPYYFTIDLGYECTIEYLSFKWSSGSYECPNRFRVEISSDNENFVVVEDIKNFYNGLYSGGYLNIILNQNTTARYIKVTTLKYNNIRGAQLHELQVYGNDDAPRELNMPNNITASGTIDSVTLEWNEPYKYWGEVLYNIYRGDNLIGQTYDTFFTDNDGLKANSKYSYSVEAANNYGVKSAKTHINASTKYEAIAETCNPNATQSAKAVLNYLASLSSKDDKKLVVGQFANHGAQLTTADNEDPMFHYSYDTYINGLQREYGYTPGMMAADYGFSAHPLGDLLKANTAIIDFWNKGGLIHINWTAPNPWTGGYAGDLTMPNGSDLDWVIDASKPNNAVDAWMAEIKKIGDALTVLRDAGVVVLFRPMQEMNGWFWYSTEDYNKAQAFKRVYRHLYNYFTYDRGLNNLLWIYSPTASDQLLLYPGDDYVDICAPTLYANDWELNLNNSKDYMWIHNCIQALLSTGKVFGFAEAGPLNWPIPNAKNNFDNRQYVEAITKWVPEASFFTVWTDWRQADGTHYGSLLNNAYTKEMFENPKAVNITDLPDFTSSTIGFDTNRTPTITLDGVIAKTINKGETITLPKATAKDYLNANISKIQRIIKHENGEVFEVSDGKTNKQFTANFAGNYTIIYMVVDIYGNQYKLSKNILSQSTDLIPPTFTLNGEYQDSVKVNDIIKILPYTATDNVDTVVAVEVFALDPKNNRIAIKDGEFIANKNGTYTIVYCAKDSACNITTKIYKVKVCD